MSTTHQRLVKVPSTGRLGSRSISFGKNEWEAMVELAANYYRVSTGQNRSFKDCEFGDRFVVSLCQQWHKEETGDDWKFIKE
jgi:hypothetical protein